jgi:hypothetical protein
MQRYNKNNKPFNHVKHMRHTGYDDAGECGSREFFSSRTVDIISNKITQLLQGVDPQNRIIHVPDNRIQSVMSSVHDDYRPEIGDIHSRYIIPVKNGQINMVTDLIDQTIELIVSDVKNNIETEENNKKLTIWTTLLGDFNEHGLRQHSAIKIRNKHPTRGEFNMNY